MGHDNYLVRVLGIERHKFSLISCTFFFFFGRVIQVMVEEQSLSESEQINLHTC